jgi:molecular chaperone DnaK
MVKDAEAHAAEDKQRRQLVEARNQGEALIHSTEKSLAELGEKVAEGDKSAVEAAVAELKTAIAGENVEDIQAKSNTLAQAAMKLGEAMYKSAEAQQGETQAGEGGQGAKEDVVDADFEEVDEDKKRQA